MLHAALVSGLACFALPQDPVEAAAVAEVAVSPTAENSAAWRGHILPHPDEVRWESIPWESTFVAGLRAASEQGRPLLFWGMNGHPLGCT